MGKAGRTLHDTIPPRPGHVVAAAVWKWDRDRQRYRLQQVIYEPRKRAERAEPAAKPDRRQGLLI